MSIRLRWWCCALVLAFCPNSALSAQDTSLVVVGKDRVEITIIPPKMRVRQTRNALIGFYSWRVDLKTSDGQSIVVASDTVMRTDNIRDLVRGSTLRRCPLQPDFSSLRCNTVMPDSLTVRGDAVRIVLRDAAIVALIRKDRPLTMWGSAFEPNGRFRVDRLAVEYDDEDEAPARSALPETGNRRPNSGRPAVLATARKIP